MICVYEVQGLKEDGKVAGGGGRGPQWWWASQRQPVSAGYPVFPHGHRSVLGAFKAKQLSVLSPASLLLQVHPKAGGSSPDAPGLQPSLTQVYTCRGQTGSKTSSCTGTVPKQIGQEIAP